MNAFATAADLGAALSSGELFRRDYLAQIEAHDRGLDDGTVWAERMVSTALAGGPWDYRTRYEVIFSDGHSRMFDSEEAARACMDAHPEPPRRTPANKLARELVGEGRPLIEPDETVDEGIAERRASLRLVRRLRLRETREVRQARAELIVLRLRRRAA